MRNASACYRVIAAVVFIAAVSSVWIYRNFSRDLDSARARVSISEVVDTRCGPVEYAAIGQGAPLLVVHGSGGGFDQGLDFGAAFAAQGFRVIAMSRFGYLKTPLPPNASAEAQADAHACLLDALGVKRATIVGASAGAPSALQFALRHPDRCSGVVLVVPALYVPRAQGTPSVKVPRDTQFLFDTALKSDFLFWFGPSIARNVFLKSIFATSPDLVRDASPEEKDRVDMMIEHILPVSVRRLGLLNDSKVIQSLPRYPLEEVRAPTLAISVADDLFGTYDAAQYTAAHIPNARFVGYETGGHLFVDRRAAMVAEISSFLKVPNDNDEK